MENKEKAINLFHFIKGLNEMRKNVITDLSNHMWYKYISDIVTDEEYVNIFSRDIVVDEDVDDNMTLISVKKPNLTPCPKPDKELEEWINKDWNDFNKDIICQKSLKIKVRDSYIEKRFEDEEDLKVKFESWNEKREAWRKEQKRLNAIKILFVDLVRLHIELEANSETEEMIVANGIFVDNHNKEIMHPLITKKVITKFDEENNIISIVDTNNTSELYVSMLRGIDCINHEPIKKFNAVLSKEDYHPLNTVELPVFLRGLSNSLSTDSCFYENKSSEYNLFKERFAVYLNPLIIVRKKLDSSLKSIETIIDTIKETEYVPNHLCDILSGGKVDVPVDLNSETLENKLASAGGESTDIFLAKEANREQLEIAKRIELYNAVLVQGPPGTGKTHTIANLLGHFLAQGKSVLITSHTSKALKVLKDKISPEIRDLCVSVLDDTSTDMEKSIDGITEHMTISSFKYKKDMDDKYNERKEVIKQLADTRKKIFELINKENNVIVINGEEISPSDAAKFVTDNADLGYIPGTVLTNSALPLNSDELIKLYKTNGLISLSEEDELNHNLPNPKDLISPSEFSKYHDDFLNDVNNLNKFMADTGWKVNFKDNKLKVLIQDKEFIFENLDVKMLEEFINYFSSYKNNDKWLLSAAIDGARGKVYKDRWIKLTDSINKTIMLSEQVVEKSFGKRISNIDFKFSNEDIDALHKLKDKFSKNKKIWKFGPIFNKNIANLIDTIKINDESISNAEDVDLVLSINELNVSKNNTAILWDDLVFAYGGPKFYDLDTVNQELKAHKWSKIYEKFLMWIDTDCVKLNSFIEYIGAVPNELFGINDFDLEDDVLKKQLYVVNNVIPNLYDCLKICLEGECIKNILNQQLIFLESDSKLNSEICATLYNATNSINVKDYTKAYANLSELYDKYDLLSTRKELLAKVDCVAHDWAEAIEKREDIHGLSSVPNDIRNAWKWKQYEQVLKDLLNEPFEVLQEKSVYLSKRYREVTAEYAEKSAWYHLLCRTESDLTLKQSLIGWKQTVKKIGKGTGKNAPMLKAKAKEMMALCQKAVPAWIMTVNKALESLDPRENRFDIVIIDEASQSDLSSLAILYMAKKIIVVGDDKQVSPMAVGVQSDKIKNLADEYLNGTTHLSHLFDAKTSIYDIAATTFQPLMLTEHFRCVPEIINYSNMLSYDWKIKPLRDANTSKLLPATVNYRVDGFAYNKVNEVEVDTIVALIKSCIDLPEYADKTFGVISLLGEEQAILIQNKLLDELGTKEYTRRKILCGNSANFQGDERDVIFLSMVDSGNQEGPLRMKNLGVDEANKKRYNVAVSRARDQLWLVNSLDSNSDLKSGDIRKQLIEYVKNPKAFEVKFEEIKKNADSPFEIEVVSALVTRGYNIVQQWEVGSYRLDIVVQCGNKKIAIECDGERYHGADRAEYDLERQTILERIGWKFIRIRGSEYYSNKEATIERIVKVLTANQIYPEENMIVEDMEDTSLLEKVKKGALDYLQGI